MLISLPTSSSHAKPVFARSGWEIPQESEPAGSQNLVSGDADSITNFFISKYPMIKIRSKSTYPYNCVGMVFASRRTWINANHLEKILIEDNYKKIDIADVKIGDLVIYEFLGTPSHVGIVYDSNPVGREPNFWVISKWGDAYEMLHPMWAVPEGLGQPVRYYTDRVG